jgi:ArsR family transcriptional regulator
MTELVRAAKAFADPTRVRILVALRKQELCVCELCDALEITQSTLSTHLQIIREAKLVNARKEGKWSYYAVEREAKRLLDSLFGFFARSIESDVSLREDVRRLRHRMALRSNGACCVGFAYAMPDRPKGRK